MASCISCGNDVTGKKFCAECGTPVQSTPVTNAQSVSSSTCPRCGGASRSGAGFCMHCGAALNVGVQQPPARATPPPPPSTRPCPACQTQVSADHVFCTNCGHDMRAAAVPQMGCPSCGRQNAPGVRFCAGCGSQLVPAAPVQPGYGQPAQYQQPQYQQYQQPQYQQYQQYPQPYNQGGYQPQPMLGQRPMVLRCPTCMAMAPLGTPSCLSCRTSLAGVVPTSANVPIGQQQGGGFLQGNGGNLMMGALGGAAAVIGGEMLLHGLENSIENRVEGDMGFGERRHHRHNEGLLGGLGELADDIGL